jgi:hypothetical protein
MNEPLYARRLIAILEDKNPDMYCPESNDNKQRYPGKHENEDSATCTECKAFVSLDSYDDCPCDQLGCRKAAKRAWLALEEKGYLD